MNAQGLEKEEHMRRTGAVMLTMHLLKTNQKGAQADQGCNRLLHSPQKS
jgi:hypothetical protein